MTGARKERLVLVRSTDKRSDGYVRWEGWEPGDKAVARFFDIALGEWMVGEWNRIRSRISNDRSQQ